LDAKKGKSKKSKKQRKRSPSNSPVRKGKKRKRRNRSASVDSSSGVDSDSGSDSDSSKSPTPEKKLAKDKINRKIKQATKLELSNTRQLEKSKGGSPLKTKRSPSLASARYLSAQNRVKHHFYSKQP